MLRKVKRKVAEIKVAQPPKVECEQCWHESHPPSECAGYDGLTGKCFCTHIASSIVDNRH